MHPPKLKMKICKRNSYMRAEATAQKLNTQLYNVIVLKQNIDNSIAVVNGSEKCKLKGIEKRKKMNLQRMEYFVRGSFIFRGHGRVATEDWSSEILRNIEYEKPDMLLYCIIARINKLELCYFSNICMIIYAYIIPSGHYYK